MSPPLALPEYCYSLVNAGEDEKRLFEEPQQLSLPSTKPTKWIYILSLLLACSLLTSIGLVGLLILKTSQDFTEIGKVKPAIELDPLSVIFESNRSYLQRPSNDSDRIWSALYPANHGFFDYPDINPLRSTFAGFHQLHCVDSLRRGFYQVYDSRQALLDGHDISYHLEAEYPQTTITLDHILHCIEFLRQSVMCHADTTVEAKDENFHGVVGFGIAHSCRDWGQLVGWVDERNGLK